MPHKRTALIVSAMTETIRAIPDAQLHLVGGGPERAQLEQQVHELGLDANVIVHGALTATERDDLLTTAWLTVSASQREGWGLSILEANAFGVPAVALRRPGLRDSIRSGETGWLVDHDDQLPAALVNALLQLMDPAVAASTRVACHQWVGQFSWEAMTERFATTIAGEAHRLALLPERRLGTDLACVADIPHGILPDGWVPQLRLDDQIAYHDDHITVLFHGADTDTARLALARIGLGPQLSEREDVRIRVARPTDLLALPAPLPVGMDSSAVVATLHGMNGTRG